jgi:hypothetical protein
MRLTLYAQGLTRRGLHAFRSRRYASGKSPERRRINLVYDVMIATLNVPQNDRSQIISLHEGHDLIMDRPTGSDASWPRSVAVEERDRLD